MSILFHDSDLQIFDIPDFTGRMAEIRRILQPKLATLGSTVAPLLSAQFKQPFFVHVAKHMRRRVNPPDETWVAFGPQARSYKAFVFFAFCLGKTGAQARVTMKDESALRPALAKNLLDNRIYFENAASQWKGLKNYAHRDAELAPAHIENLPAFIVESSGRLTQFKSSVFDIGFELKAVSRRLPQDVVESFNRLYPFYECGRGPNVTFVGASKPGAAQAQRARP